MKRRTGKASASKSKATDRKREAFELRKRGLTFDQIGERLGVSRQAAHVMVTTMLDETIAQTKTDAKQIIEMELQRLDEMLSIAMETARAGDVTAIDRVVKLMERRAKYLGLDAANRTEISGPDGAPVTVDVVNGLRAKLARIAESDAAREASGKPDDGGSEGA